MLAHQFFFDFVSICRYKIDFGYGRSAHDYIDDRDAFHESWPIALVNRQTHYLRSLFTFRFDLTWCCVIITIALASSPVHRN